MKSIARSYFKKGPAQAGSFFLQQYRVDDITVLPSHGPAAQIGIERGINPFSDDSSMNGRAIKFSARRVAVNFQLLLQLDPEKSEEH